jgi:hypothetical protein
MPRLAEEQQQRSVATPIRKRPDIAPNLLHLVSGETRSAAFAALRTVVAERQLRGSDAHSPGGYRCVSFTEAPVKHLRDVYRWSTERDARLQPCGVLLGKDYLYALGGRPVIYQPDAEYAQLPEPLRYRHASYDPLADPPIDFTWQREWRLHADVLALEPERCCIVVASEEDRATLFTAHAEQEELRLEGLVSAVGRSLAGQFAESFPWPVISLDVHERTHHTPR